MATPYMALLSIPTVMRVVPYLIFDCMLSLRKSSENSLEILNPTSKSDLEVGFSALSDDIGK